MDTDPGRDVSWKHQIGLGVRGKWTSVSLSPQTEDNSEAEVAVEIAEEPPCREGPAVRGIGDPPPGPSSDKQNQALSMTGQVYSQSGLSWGQMYVCMYVCIMREFLQPKHSRVRVFSLLQSVWVLDSEVTTVKSSTVLGHRRRSCVVQKWKCGRLALADRHERQSVSGDDLY